MSSFFMSSQRQNEVITLPSPYAFWPMQEGTGATLDDSIGALDMTIVGATWGTGTGRSGTNCLAFADSQRAYRADPFYMEEFTICAWIYPTTMSTQKSILCKRNNSSGNQVSSEFELWISATNLLTFRKYDSGSASLGTVNGTNALTLNAWNHVAVSAKGTSESQFIYLNGDQEGTTVQTGVMNNGAAVLEFGGMTSNTSTRYFHGRMQEVRIYNVRLTGSQVAAVYALPPP